MSFFDHFSGSSLDTTRWTAITNASGTVTVTDSYVYCNCVTTAANAAAIYLNTPISLATSQTISVCYSLDSIATNRQHRIFLIDKATVPACEAVAAFQARVLIQLGSINGNSMALSYTDSGGTVQYWDESTDSWTAVATGYNVAIAADYYEMGIENDAVNSRFRLFGVHYTTIAGYSVDAGKKLFALTGWVNWSSARARPNSQYLVIGEPYTDNQSGGSKTEWVRVADGTKQYAYTNSKNAVSGGYVIRANWSYDGKYFVPIDQSTTIEGASANLKDPWVVYDGTTYWLFCRSNGAAKSVVLYSSTDPEGTFTLVGTLLAPGVNESYFFPHVYYTPWDIHPWQMLVNVTDTSASPPTQIMRYAWANTANGTWTVGGTALGLGAVGADDEDGNAGGVAVRENGQWAVYYTGLNSSTKWIGGLRATGTTLASLTRDGVSGRLQPQNQSEAITVNLGGNTATMASTTGFSQDQMVYAKNSDSDQDLWNGTKVRKVNTNTSLELYFGVYGYTTASAALIIGGQAGAEQIRDIKVQSDGSTYIYLTQFQVAGYEAASYNIFAEESTLLIVPAGTSLSSMTQSMISWQDSPTVMRGSWANIRSNENISLVHTSVSQGGGQMYAIGRGRRRSMIKIGSSTQLIGHK